MNKVITKENIKELKELIDFYSLTDSEGDDIILVSDIMYILDILFGENHENISLVEK